MSKKNLFNKTLIASALSLSAGVSVGANATEANWAELINLSGVVELEASYVDPYQGDSESDFVVATAELGLATQLHEFVSAEITLLYEEDDTDLDVDVATLNFDFGNGIYAIAGQQYLPFGSYETAQISDPLTLEIAELAETAVLVGFEKNGFNGNFYAFNGDLDEGGDSQIDSFGASLGYSLESDNHQFSANLRYLNNLGDSDTLTDHLGEDYDADYVAAVAADALYRVGDISFIAEYLAAQDSFEAAYFDFNGNDAEPSAWHVEVAMDFSLADLPATFGLAYHGSDEAVALELPEQRIMTTLALEVYENTTLAFEYAYDSDYDQHDGGSDENASNITVQLAYEF